MKVCSIALTTHSMSVKCHYSNGVVLIMSYTIEHTFNILHILINFNVVTFLKQQHVTVNVIDLLESNEC